MRDDVILDGNVTEAPTRRDGYFYVYELCTEDGKPFYVGKGKTWRWNHHLAEARRNPHRRVHWKILSLIREGNRFIKKVDFRTKDESAALSEEIRRIEMYGRKNLTNLTVGGEGTSGIIGWNKGIPWSNEVKQKMSIAQKGKPRSRESILKISAALKGKIPKSIELCWTPEARAKHSATMMGRTVPPETRAKISATLKKAHRVPKHTGKSLPDEWKNNIKTSMIARGRAPCAEAHRKSAYSKALTSLIFNTQKLGYCGA